MSAAESQGGSGLLAGIQLAAIEGVRRILTSSAGVEALPTAASRERAAATLEGDIAAAVTTQKGPKGPASGRVSLVGSGADIEAIATSRAAGGAPFWGL